MIYLTSLIEDDLIDVESQISSNCGLPNDFGTIRWASVTKAINSDLWFIPKPPVNGWGNHEVFTQSQMINNIDLTNIIEMEFDASWLPLEIEL